jgi:Sulfatase
MNLQKCFTYSGIISVPLYFVLDAYNQFWGMIPAMTGIKILFIFIPVAALACFLLGIKIPVEKALIFLMWLMVNYLFFKYVKDRLILFTGAKFLYSYKIYLPLLGIISLFIGYILLRLKSSRAVRLSIYLNTLFIVLVVIEVGESVYHLFYTKSTPFKTEMIELTKLDKKPHPSIYLFVLDEYAGSKTMSSDYNFTNSAFTEQLKKKSFFVPAKPNSNYNGTPFSVLSMLNMAYIDELKGSDIKSVVSYSKCADAIKDNKLMSFFLSNGYRLINNSFFSINYTTREKYLFLPVEDRLMLDKTFGSVLLNDLLCTVNSNKFHKIINDLPSRIDKYNQTIIQKSFNTIEKKRGPVFMYSHLMIPHAPFLRNQFGELRNMGEAYRESNGKMNIAAYINYMQYCNTVMLKMVDAVLRKDSSAIIVITSDHGLRNVQKGDVINSEFNNFMAIRAPANQYAGFTDSTCMVNLFRLVLNNHFEQNLRLLPNQKVNVNLILAGKIKKPF